MARKKKVADLTNVFDNMREKWKNLPQEGYIYTISIDDTCKLSAMGLAEVSSHIKLSCSHPGHDPLGLYCGELAVEYEAGYGGISSLLTLIGGGVQAKQGGWFKNDKFVMNLVGYKQSDEIEFFGTIGKNEENAKQSLIDSVGELINATNGIGLKDFEKEEPTGMWCDWEYRMTEGDMSNWAKVFVLGGLGKGSSQQTNDGHQVTGDTHVHLPLVGSFSDHFDETIDGPFPYTLKVFPDGNVVFELYNYGGGASMKWYGTIDKIPIEDTIEVK